MFRQSLSAFAARFAKIFDEEAAKLYSKPKYGVNTGLPRGFLAPTFIALTGALRAPRNAHIGREVRLRPEPRFGQPRQQRRKAAELPEAA
jgi:hypothetical protein